MFLKVFTDLVLVLILIGGSYYGYKRGLIRLLARPLRPYLSLLVAFNYCRPLGSFAITPIIENPISELIKKYLYERFAVTYLKEGTEEIPTALRLALTGLGAELLGEAHTLEDALEIIRLTLSDMLVDLLSTVIAFLLIYIITKLAISLLVNLIDSLADKCLLGAVNRFLGIVVSFALSFIAARLVAFGIYHLINAEVINAPSFDGGPLFRFFISFSPLGLLLSF